VREKKNNTKVTTPLENAGQAGATVRKKVKAEID
jgi:hypothetical protein